MYFSMNYVLFTIWIFINILYQFRTVKKTNSSAKIWLVFQITNTVMISRIVQILLMKCLVQPLQWVKTQKFLGFFFPKEGQLQIHYNCVSICLFLAHRANNHNSKTSSNLQKQWILLSKLQLMFYFMQQCVRMSRTSKRNHLSRLSWEWISMSWFQTLYFKFFDLWWKRWLFWWIWWKAAMQWYVQICLFLIHLDFWEKNKSNYFHSCSLLSSWPFMWR